MKIKTFYPFVLIAQLILLCTTAYSQAGRIDSTFNTSDIGNGFGDGTNNEIYITRVRPDGKIIAGGYFQTYNSTPISCLIQLNSDGTRDTSFHTGTGPNSSVFSMAIQPDGKILIGGFFTMYNGIPANRLARINTDGSFDNTFYSSLTDSGVDDIVVLPDGKIVFGGSFTKGIRKCDASGVLDPTFSVGSGTNNGGTVYHVLLQTDGKLILTGNFTSFNGTSCNRIVRLNANGTIDFSFNPGSGASDYNIYAAALQPDGKIIIAGDFATFNGVAVNNIARLNTDGSLDLTFNSASGFDNTIFQTYLQSDGKILVGGAFTTYDNSSYNRIIRLNSDGSIDYTFNPGEGVDNNLGAIATLPNGNIILGGSFVSYNAMNSRYLALIDSLGNLNAFNVGTGADGDVFVSRIQPNGQAIIAGDFTAFNGDRAMRITRINSNGSRDTSFVCSTGPNAAILSSETQADGKIIIGGNFTQFGNTPTGHLARINPNGGLDTLFSSLSSANGAVHTIGLQNDGKLIVGGDFSTFNQNALNRIARINSDGTLDASFLSTGANSTIFASHIQNNGKIILGGDFTSYNDTLFNRIVRLNENGTIDTSFQIGTGANGTIRCVAVQTDGKILVGGNFTSINSISVSRIARLNANGSMDLSFNPGSGANNTVYSIVLKTSGEIVLSGDFTAFNGTSEKRIVRLHVDGSVDESFSSLLGANNTIRTCSIDETDNTAWIGGKFTNYDGVGRNRLAKVINCSPISDTLAVNACINYTWNLSGSTYSSSGFYSYTSSGVVGNGCDSIYVLNLIITSPTTGTDVQVACDSLLWIDGITYFASTNTPTWILTNSAGCDSVVTLNLTITNSTTGTDVQTICDSFTWIDGITYTVSTNTPTWTLINAAGCDSIVTLDLTIILSQPTVIETAFSLPSDPNNCLGAFAIDLAGTPDFEVIIDGNTPIVSSGYSLISDICPGVHDLQIVNLCGDTLTSQFVVPVDSNYVFNNPFLDSLVQDSLGVTLEDCIIYYNGIDTAYIDSIWANGNTVNVIWNIVDSNGSNFDTTSYELNSGNGVYYLQLSVFCPSKAVEDYFTVTEAIYYENGTISSAGINDLEETSVWLYPNPTNDLVTITFDGNEAELVVYDAQGKLIQTSTITSGAQVSLRNVETGVYFFELNTENGKNISRIIKQ